MNTLPLILATGVTPVGVAVSIIIALLLFAVFYIAMAPNESKASEAEAVTVAIAKFSDIPREPFKDVISQFYLLQEGEATGPYSIHEIRSLHTAGKLHADTQLARGGESDWTDLQEWLRGITKPVPAVPTAGSYLPSSKPKTIGGGLMQAGFIIGGLGLVGALLGVGMFGPLGVVFGSSAIGLGLVLIIIGACIK